MKTLTFREKDALTGEYIAFVESGERLWLTLHGAGLEEIKALLKPMGLVLSDLRTAIAELPTEGY